MSVLPAVGVESGRAVVDACWNRIGVRGDRSCPQLAVHIHCRNCTTYSAAARALLDGPPPADYSRAWAEHYAQPAAALASETRSIMIFRVGAEWFAVPTRLCVEVASARAVHSLPHRRDGALLGLASVRSELVVCVSLAAILSVATSDGAGRLPRETAPKRLLVVGWQDGSVAFPVDEVLGVHSYRMEDLKDVPATVAYAQAKYTQAILWLAQRSVGILDDELLHHAINRSLG